MNDRTAPGSGPAGLKQGQMRVLLLANAKASRAEASLCRIVERLRASCQAETHTPSSAEDLQRAIEAHGGEADRILIGGGDGTIFAALPSLLKAKKPVGIVPLGTANDFARTLGLSGDPMEALEVGLCGRPHAVDVGLVNGRPFLNVASAGLAARVTRAQSAARKRSWRGLSYVISLHEVLKAARPFWAEVEIDGERCWRGFVYQVSVGNGRYHGGGLTTAEDAAVDDGLLDLYLVRPGSFWQLAGCLAQLRFGLEGDSEVLQRRKGERVRLRTARPRAINADGELCTETPAAFALLHGALTVLVPFGASAPHRALSRQA